ncbi:transcription antitermination factor NusB [Winogradskyella alexanderae]|uniref:Transcription antitermination factor NusB n=1 Tax=Winogradskyella alexanderae TaxID=2877123 RepID=A0ABS7XQQ8_9FLAO|nr:transcription antitermination factor NusB [Winogradskyella alexanderae]MCA0132333.1 transcription antitermination factor NusB [Winogradskyella alexanderae]
MLNRRHIRIKVMQSLYAFKSTEGDDITKDEKFLLHSINSMYDLYLSILALLIQIHKKSQDYSQKVQNKLSAVNAIEDDGSKFANNQFLKLIGNNKMLQGAIAKKKLNFWDLDSEYVDILFKAIIKNPIYEAYINNETSSFKTDKQFVLDIYTNIIAPNDKLYDYFEDKQLTWVDDLPVVNTNLIKIFKKLGPNASETALLPELFKDTDDKQFALDLLRKTLLNSSSLVKEIASKTTNWDSERLASLDGTLLKMAICEFQKFPSIPQKVTINEYLEIAKEYSTPKSSLFLNGVLDKIVKEYQSKGLHPKAGRGLM